MKNRGTSFYCKIYQCSHLGISETKLDASVLQQEISIDNFKTMRCDRNRHGGGVSCYIRNDLNYNIISVFSCEIENITNSKPVIVGTIYRPQTLI